MSIVPGTEYQNQTSGAGRRFSLFYDGPDEAADVSNVSTPVIENSEATSAIITLTQHYFGCTVLIKTIGAGHGERTSKQDLSRRNEG